MATIKGTSKKNTLKGTSSADKIIGLGGNDRLLGNAGDDFLNGGDGNDTLLGGKGNDRLIGEAGRDTLQGDSGNDLLEGGASADTYNGGSGIDTVSYANDKSGLSVRVDLNGVLAQQGAAAGEKFSLIENLTGTRTGADTLVGNASANLLSGLGGDDVLLGGGGLDTLLGGTGDDFFAGGALGTGTDVYDGGSGDDIVSYAGATTAGVFVSLEFANTINGTTGGFNNDIFRFIEGVVGSSGGDTLIGNSEDNLLFGQEGADFLSGEGGNDTLSPGEDGAAADVLDGGAGYDTVSFVGFSAGITATIVAGLTTKAGPGGFNANTDSLTNIENVIGSDFDDSIVVQASALNNVAADANGGAGNDTLIAGPGFVGGVENLTGGAGSDKFQLLRDTGNGQVAEANITDFESGTDKILLKSSEYLGITSNTLVIVNTNFVLATAGAPQLLYDFGANALYFDVDGQPGGEVQIATFSNNPGGLSGSDFLFI